MGFTTQILEVPKEYIHLMKYSGKGDVMLLMVLDIYVTLATGIRVTLPL
jgi:hypothetical protein